jgi:hypothetical protein
MGFHTWYNYTGLETMNKKLDRIEAYLQNFFEEKLVQLITGRVLGDSIIERLVGSMKSNLKQDPEGRLIAPDQFLIRVNPQDLLDWQTHQDILDQIAERLQEMGEQEGILFLDTPSVTILSDPKSPEEDYTVSIHFSLEKTHLPDTTALPQSEPDDLSIKIPEEACLIVRGTKTFPLNKAVINIGRHSENDLVLNDPHISRHHAQLRVINQHYVLFDVGSTGGVFLNNKKINQATLQSGDVIRLGIINLIYVQESIVESPTTVFSIEDEGVGQ